MGQILILNDGTILTPAHAIPAGGVLWVYIDGDMTLAEAFELLNDPEKTGTIEANEYGSVTTYEGYTDLYCITREDNGRINAGLKMGVDRNV
jgi:hypothetical protein